MKFLLEHEHELPEGVDELTHELHWQRSFRGAIAVGLFILMIIGLVLGSHYLGGASLLP